MHTVVGEQVFPFLRTLGGDGSTDAHHMKDARFTIPTPRHIIQLMVEMTAPTSNAINRRALAPVLGSPTDREPRRTPFG